MQENSKKVYKHGVCVEDFNNEHWEFIRNLTKEEYFELGLSKNVRGWYKCKHCGEVTDSRKSGFKIKLLICKNECNGVRQGNSRQFVLRGVNDLATTHPHLVKYFVNKEDAHRHFAKSGQKIKTKCPSCGVQKEMFALNLARRGFSCSICSDGVSYPEKLIGAMLNQIDIDFKKEVSLDKGKTRYDFYIGSRKTIIEVHGEQHYLKGFYSCGGRTVEEEQANDRYKHGLALENGIEHYIVIDARESSLEWIRNSVLNSELTNLFNFSNEDIDWDKIANECESSLVKEVCDYFKMKGGTATNVAKIFRLNISTVIKYLKRGTEMGWCDFGEETRRQNMGAKEVKGVNKDSGEEVIFPSTMEAGRWLLEIGATNKESAFKQISACCLGKCKSAYGYVWSYIDDTEETDNQSQTNQNT